VIEDELAYFNKKRKAIEISLKAGRAACAILRTQEGDLEKKIGRRGLNRLRCKLKKEHRAFCIKRFGKKIWRQTNDGWFQSCTRWESKHYNGWVQQHPEFSRELADNVREQLTP